MRREVLDELPGEFPRIDERRAGLPYRHDFRVCQVPGAAGAGAIVHHDLGRGSRSLFTLNEGERAPEAAFVPGADEAAGGEGSLLTVVWRPELDDSALLVLDARQLEHGPLAIVSLPRRVPFGFHGSWLAATGPV